MKKEEYVALKANLLDTIKSASDELKEITEAYIATSDIKVNDAVTITALKKSYPATVKKISLNLEGDFQYTVGEKGSIYGYGDFNRSEIEKII